MGRGTATCLPIHFQVQFDFGNAEAVRVLSKVLLHDYFGLEVELPRDSLLPRIPQHMNYVFLVEDLLMLN